MKQIRCLVLNIFLLAPVLNAQNLPAQTPKVPDVEVLKALQKTAGDLNLSFAQSPQTPDAFLAGLNDAQLLSFMEEIDDEIHDSLQNNFERLTQVQSGKISGYGNVSGSFYTILGIGGGQVIGGSNVQGQMNQILGNEAYQIKLVLPVDAKWVQLYSDYKQFHATDKNLLNEGEASEMANVLNELFDSKKQRSKDEIAQFDFYIHSFLPTAKALKLVLHTVAKRASNLTDAQVQLFEDTKNRALKTLVYVDAVKNDVGDEQSSPDQKNKFAFRVVPTYTRKELNHWYQTTSRGEYHPAAPALLLTMNDAAFVDENETGDYLSEGATSMVINVSGPGPDDYFYIRDKSLSTISNSGPGNSFGTFLIYSYQEEETVSYFLY